MDDARRATALAAGSLDFGEGHGSLRRATMANLNKELCMSDLKSAMPVAGATKEKQTLVEEGTRFKGSLTST